MSLKYQVNSLPSLQESNFLRYFSFAALYVAQGIPNGLMFYAMPAWFALNGKSPAEIGAYVALCALPWSIKLISGPIMDRFSFLQMGRRRPWVLAGELGIFISFFCMSFVENPLDNMKWLMFFGFVVNFFTAFQDVATDGMAIDVVPINEQARANGVMWGAKTLGISGAVAAGSFLINFAGYKSTVIIFSFLVLLIMVIPLVFRERKGEKLLPWTAGEASPETKAIQLDNWGDIFKSLYKVFVLPVSLIMGLAAFSSTIGRGLIDVVLPVLTVQELGWSDTHYSNVFATSNIIAGVMGMIIGGYMVDRFGKKRMMSIIISMLIVLVLSMYFISSLWHYEIVVTGFIIIFYVLYVFLDISVFASAMNLCWKKISATQFTLYMTISNLGLSAGSAILGPLTSVFTYEQTILFFAFSGTMMFLFLRYVDFEKHQVQLKELNNKDLIKKVIPSPKPV